MKKRLILGGLASIVLAAGVLIPNNAFADIDNNPGGATIRRKKTTAYYHTTIQYNGQLVDINDSVIDTYTKTSEEYDKNYDNLATEIGNEDQAFATWAGEATTQTSRASGITDYYYDNVHDEVISVTPENKATLCAGVEGECKVDDIVVNTILHKHQIYTITATRKKNTISVIDLDFEAPAAGETNSITESEVICLSSLSCDEDSVTPVVSTNTPKVLIRNALWQVKGEDGQLSRFEGTFEEGKEYYLTVEIVPDGNISLDPQANIRVNGKEVDDGIVTGLGAIILYKFTIQPGNPDNPDTFDGVHIILGVLGSCTLAGSALFLSKAKRR
jgi:hypothetical protein